MRAYLQTLFALAVLGVIPFHMEAAHAQTNSAIVDPFQDDEDAAERPPVYNGWADAAADLFAPPGYNAQAAPTPLPRWEDLDAVDPGGRYGAGYSDTASERMKRTVEAPLEHKSPFSNPLDDFAKDKGADILFNKVGRSGTQYDPDSPGN